MSKATELFKNAIFNEVKAANFYRLAAEETTNDEARMLFLEFVDMEDDHARVIAKKAKGAGLDYDWDGYLKKLDKAVKDDEIIPKKENKIIKNGTMEQVFNLAIAMEETARKNYADMVEEAKDDALKQFCQELADEEKEHAEILTRNLRNIGMDEADRVAL
ncbi:MAG: ferritin family protein [Magnetococcales bacterium]|nr:ferritin family protein [Magnetococcales bacterium]